MNKRVSKVLATAIVFQVLMIPTTSFAALVGNEGGETKEISSDVQAIKSIENYMEDEDGRGDKVNENGEIQGEFLINIQEPTLLYESSDLQSTVLDQLSNQVVKGTKKKGNWYYIKTGAGEGWIQNSNNTLVEREIYTLPSDARELVIDEKEEIYSSPFSEFKENTILHPQTVEAIAQAGTWFQIQTSDGVKWIKSENTKFKGTKASLIQPKLNASAIYGVPFTEWIVPKGNDNIRPGYAMNAKYITIHETDNESPGAGARNHAQYLYNQATGNTDRAASWHFTVDDKEIYQHLPLNENGWHAGDGTNGTGNRQSIAIEIAVNSDGNYDKAVDNARKLTAYLMEELNISLDHVVKHQNWSGKICPSKMINRNAWGDFLSGTQAYYNANNIDDITGGWYENDIRELAAQGIMVGDGQGSYWPNRLVTRGEFATLITRALKLPEGTSNFTDLNTADPSLIDGINRAAAAGIISGRGNNIFAPNDTIMREEAVIMIDRALQYKGVVGRQVELPFIDQNLAYDRQAVQRVYGLGIVKGNEKNEFLPKGTATRGEAAAFLNRMLHVLNDGNNNNAIGVVTINGTGVNLRKGPGTTYEVIRKLNKNESYTVYKEQNGWLSIGDGQWVYYDPSYILFTKNK
ncbi:MULTISPECIES: S-layer homology domain-containing protein [Bacillus cereus group]|uniref:S-layer homology domain-containing protein n=1 Tax=Bacillus cereus group TaxID=86661 RepID=UPI0005B49880|nr:S-layer homology domain-containing protein [Bacillus cereus]HDR4351013.1 S-layer homology domain-containing protein [Bacillus cereus]HDR6957957.1 S-layer homology domain-containing protein [Bacillus cereus]